MGELPLLLPGPPAGRQDARRRVGWFRQDARWRVRGGSTFLRVGMRPFPPQTGRQAAASLTYPHLARNLVDDVEDG